NVEIVTTRAEQWKPARLFDVVISRAFSDLPGFVEAAAHLCAPAGVLAAMKGIYPGEERGQLGSDAGHGRGVAARGPRGGGAPARRVAAAGSAAVTRILAIANQKGGVGKTTTSINLAASLTLAGRRVLLIDLDPQGNATMGSGVDKRTVRATVYDVLLGAQPLSGTKVKASAN